MECENVICYLRKGGHKFTSATDRELMSSLIHAPLTSHRKNEKGVSFSNQ